MIYDRLENLPAYIALAPEVMPGIVEFLGKCGAGEIAEGRHELDGDKLFVNVMSYDTKPFNPEMLEYHKKYVDVQLLLAGNETLYYAPAGTAAAKEYSAESDCGFNMVPETALPLKLEVGNFVLLLPEEGHLPGVGDGSGVVKAVVKISVDLLA
jgi:YhcH/YjgK/YiaL family protein